MRITVPEEIMRLTVPTCTPSRDKPLVIVSPWELGGDGLHIFVWVEAVQLVGCLGNLLREHRRLTALAQAVGAGCSCRVLTPEFSFAVVALQLRACHTTQAHDWGPSSQKLWIPIQSLRRVKPRPAGFRLNKILKHIILKP